MTLQSRLVNLESVTAAPGSGVAALLAAGLGVSAVYDHEDDDGTNTLLAADADDDRAVIIVASVTETFAGTTKPLVNIGETSTVTKFKQIGEGFLTGTDGLVYVAAGTLTATKALLVTVVNGSGGTPAGKVNVTAFVLPIAG